MGVNWRNMHKYSKRIKYRIQLSAILSLCISSHHRFPEDTFFFKMYKGHNITKTAIKSKQDLPSQRDDMAQLHLTWRHYSSKWNAKPSSKFHGFKWTWIKNNIPGCIFFLGCFFFNFHGFKWTWIKYVSQAAYFF